MCLKATSSQPGIQSTLPFTSTPHQRLSTEMLWTRGFEPSHRQNLLFSTRSIQSRASEIQLRHDQLVLEYNPMTSDTNTSTQVAFSVRSAGPRKDSEGTITLWHRRMGHLHREAVEKLPTAVLGVKLAKTSPISCEPCELAKSHQIVSCRLIERATRLFTQIHMDLIQLQPTYNGDTWMLHFSKIVDRPL